MGVICAQLSPLIRRALLQCIRYVASVLVHYVIPNIEESFGFLVAHVAGAHCKKYVVGMNIVRT